MFLRDGVDPVDIGIEVRIVPGFREADLLLRERQRDAAVRRDGVHDLHIGGRIDEFRKLRRLAHGDLVTQRDFRRSHLAALGVDQDHTVGTPHAVDSARGGILQDRERLDLGRVHVVERTLDAVDQHQRRGASGEGADAANPEIRIVLARLARALHGDHARKLPRKVVAQRAVGTDLQVLRGEALDGPHDAQFPLRAVAHDDHFVEFRNLLFENDMEVDPTADHDFLRLVADEAEAQNAFLVGDIDEETAFGIGRNALRGAFEQDRNADHRLFFPINDQAVNRDRCRRSRRRGQKQGEDGQHCAYTTR